MDGAPILYIEIAQNKAYTALFGGGLPIKVGGAIVGATGVSGGTAQNDVDCVQAAIGVVK